MKCCALDLLISTLDANGCKITASKVFIMVMDGMMLMDQWIALAFVM